MYKEEYEFCPRCEANLTLQKGYSNSLPFWICKGCGEMLINPEVPGDVAWICDSCGTMLNIQPGFSEDCESFKCTECGYENVIGETNIYLSEEEFQMDYNSPYKGLADKDILTLLSYEEERAIDKNSNIFIVRSTEDSKLYVRKILSIYDASIYRFLAENPIENMPQIMEVFESDNNLIIIEEYIEGQTLHEIVEEGVIEPKRAVLIVKKLCCILKRLHDLETPIIHRDIKPSNIIMTPEGEVVLLDMNVAKWYKEDEIEDTRLLGTQYYAAPEQLGYGFSASSVKSDIFALGMLLNVMVTGKFPKEEKAGGSLWKIVEKCICLEAKDRYSDDELLRALDEFLR